MQRICIPFQKNVLTLRENFVIKSQQQEQQQQQQLHHQQEEEEGLNKCSSEPSFPQISINKWIVAIKLKLLFIKDLTLNVKRLK